MKSKLINILQNLMFVIIPILSVLVCIALKIAQGEKNEEIAFGILVGLVLDLIYFIILLLENKNRE